MQTIRTSRSHPSLRQFVRCYAQREMTCPAQGSELPFIASLESILSFNFADREIMDRTRSQSQLVARSHILGPQTACTRRARFQGHMRAFGIFLKPQAFWRLFRVPSQVLTDQD